MPAELFSWLGRCKAVSLLFLWISEGEDFIWEYFFICMILREIIKNSSVIKVFFNLIIILKAQQTMTASF